MRKTPLRSRRSGIRRTPRKAAEFARVYGSKARVAWIKQLGCVLCEGVPCDNAHTVGGGVGYKAGYDTIVPLCRPHHQAYDGHDLTALEREFIQSCAAHIERVWQARSGGPEHISSVVARVMEELK